MSTLQEATAVLAAVKVKVDAVAVEVAHVGGETDALIARVAALEAAAGTVTTSPEFDAALQAVSDSADSVAVAVKSVDDKVADVAA